METNNRYSVWLYPSGDAVISEPINSEAATAEGLVRHAKLIPEEMDLEGGVILFDEEEIGPVNMAATKLCALPSGAVICGRVLFGILKLDGTIETEFCKGTADWIFLWAGDRCAVCGRSDKPLVGEAFPISTGRCCEKCDAVLKSLRWYMGVGKWKPRGAK